MCYIGLWMYWQIALISTHGLSGRRSPYLRLMLFISKIMSDITLEAHGQNRTDDNGFADRPLNLLGTWAFWNPPFTSLVWNSRASTIIPKTSLKDFVKLYSFTFTLSALYEIKLWILTFNAWTLCFELYSAPSGFSIKSRVQIKLSPVLSQLSYSGFRQKAGSNCRHHGICFIISILAEWCRISLLFYMRLYPAKVS